MRCLGVLLAAIFSDHLIVHGALSTDDQLRKWKEYGGKAAKDLIVIPHLKTDPVDNGVSAVEHVLYQGILDLPLTKLEVKDKSLYSCAKKGIIYLEEYSSIILFRDDKTSLESDSEKYNLITKLRFVDPRVKYPLYLHYTSALMADIKDDLSIQFNSIEAELRGRLDTSSELINKVAKKECVFHIKEMKVTSISPPQIKLKSTRGMRGRRAIKSFNRLIRLKMDQLKEDLEVNFKTGYYEPLTTTGKWLCLDQDVDSEKKTNDEMHREAVSPEEFTKYCGNDK